MRVEYDGLDLCGAAKFVISADGRGEISFCAMQATLDVEHGPTSVAFEWFGFDGGDEIAREGDAELLDDGSIKIEFAYNNGDEAVLTARRRSSSTAC